jgi:competence protein ComFB
MINALEEVVLSTFRALREQDADFCRCQQCEDDVVLLAMNQAKPRYIGEAPLGAAVTRVALAQDGAKAEIAVLVMDAMKKVAAKPRHGSLTTPGYNEPVEPEGGAAGG